jgi:hypothetical protein
MYFYYVFGKTRKNVQTKTFQIVFPVSSVKILYLGQVVLYIIKTVKRCGNNAKVT